MLDKLTHAEQVVSVTCVPPSAVPGPSSAGSQVAAVLEPPTHREFEPDHVVADPE
jgi:hypothetical protein